MPSAVENYLAFGKQIQMGYWALVEMECLAMNHEMALLPGLLSLRKIPSNTPSRKVGAPAATQFETGLKDVEMSAGRKEVSDYENFHRISLRSLLLSCKEWELFMKRFLC